MKVSCRSCGDAFKIENSDLEFYQKVSPSIHGKKLSIPHPTHCPDCRNTRRMTWRNDRSMYVRKSDLSGQRMVSIYPESAPFPVYHPSEWYSDKWNPQDYAQEVDFSRPFFEQWCELMHKVPRLGVDIVNCENSDYCNYCGDDKNCYLDIAGEANEDCYFNLFTKYSRDCADCTFVYNSTLCYECINCYDSYNCRYSMYLTNCADCDFCYDLIGCKNCLFSVNLRNKEYYIYNKAYTKDDFDIELAKLNLASRSSVAAHSMKWIEERMKKAVYRDSYVLNSENCTGNNIKNSKNCQHVFNASNCEDSKYLYDVLDAKDCQDLNYSLYKPELAYELISTLQMTYSAFNMASHYCGHVFYCDLSNNSMHLFGCIGLNRKQYCLLNKQYTKEEYEVLIPRLITHMIKTGEWGEFFPSEMSPFAYNETVAQEYMPLSKEKALANNYRWKDDDSQERTSKLNSPTDRIAEVEDSILKEVFACELCDKNFRLIKQEIKLYRRQGIPVPAVCPLCRHMKRMGLRNPRRLWDRACMDCGTAIKTTFAPDLSERVYCETCYHRELY